MISGRDALEQLVRAGDDAQRRVLELEHRLTEARERLVELDAARAEKLRALADTRLGALARGAIAERIDATDEKAMAYLRRRRERLDELERERAALDARMRELEADRSAAAGRREAAAAAVDAAEARTQRRLADDPAYRARLAAAEEAERIAVHADEKATLAEQELAEKGRAYRDDPLFSYLWDRGYGTRAYRPGGGPWAGLFRWLDGKVASLARYDRARADFARLNELPLRLREHAERVGAVADAALAEVEQAEARAREEDGVAQLDAAVDEAETALAAAEGAVDAAEAERATLDGELARYATGEDEGMRDIARFLSAELGREDLRSLRRDALATPFPEDDALVADLLELEERRDRWEIALRELEPAERRSRERLDELRSLQRTFKRERYDAPGSSFPDAQIVTTLLSQLLAGSIRGDGLWRVLERQRRFRPPLSDPTFGSGRLGGGRSWTGGAPSGLPSGRAVQGAVALGKALGGLAAAKGGKGGLAATKRTVGRIASGGFKTGGRF
jgi:hypothetical protein